MPDDGPDRQTADHRDRDLARERAAFLPVHVLRIDVDARVPQRVGDRGQGDRGRGHAHGDACGHPLGDVAGELDRVGDRRRVHFPVADDEAFAHQVRTSGLSTSRCSTSISPGQNSRAPRAISSAITTERWRPPVQPKATPSRAFFSLS